MAFCPKCGSAVGEGATFCANCGNAINTAPQTPPVNPVYGVTVEMRPKIPGRGFGITAMILGILGIVYSFSCISAASMMDYVGDVYGDLGIYVGDGFVDGALAVMVLMYSSLSILAVCFAASAFKKGYKNGISKSGMITGVIGLILYVIALINCL